MGEVKRITVLWPVGPAGYGNYPVVLASDYDAAQSQLAALREELADCSTDLKVTKQALESLKGERNDLQQRLADAERRNAVLLKAVEQSIEWFETMSSADGSGHADLARAIRRIAALNPNPEAASHDE